MWVTSIQKLLLIFKIFILFIYMFLDKLTQFLKDRYYFHKNKNPKLICFFLTLYLINLKYSQFTNVIGIQNKYEIFQVSN